MAPKMKKARSPRIERAPKAFAFEQARHNTAPTPNRKPPAGYDAAVLRGACGVAWIDGPDGLIMLTQELLARMLASGELLCPCPRCSGGGS